jgi:hypothetical protein
VRSAAADLDVAPDLAERLLELSEAARRRAHTGPLDRCRRKRLLDLLVDDELCRHGWWVAAVEGEALWWELLADAEPGRDAGAAMFLACALAARGAADHAFALVRQSLRVNAAKRSLLELGVDLAEDAGRARLAWCWAGRLDEAAAGDWTDLRRVAERGCSPSSGETATDHARWLRRRAHRWARRTWSPVCVASDPIERAAPAADPVAAAALAYLRGRRSLLPPGEQALLAAWTRTARGCFGVTRAGHRQVVLDTGRGRQAVGWEGAVPGRVRPGAVVDGWLLPTLAGDRTLFVASSRPPDRPGPGSSV